MQQTHQAFWKVEIAYERGVWRSAQVSGSREQPFRTREMNKTLSRTSAWNPLRGPSFETCTSAINCCIVS